MFDEHNKDSFFEFLPMQDLIFVAIGKGTQTELNDQCDEIASHLGITRMQFYALSAITLIDATSLNLAQDKGPLAVLVASAPATKVLCGESGPESYLARKKSDSVEMRQHPSYGDVAPGRQQVSDIVSSRTPPRGNQRKHDIHAWQADSSLGGTQRAHPRHDGRLWRRVERVRHSDWIVQLFREGGTHQRLACNDRRGFG